MNTRNVIICLAVVVAAAIAAIVYFQSDTPPLSPVVGETKSAPAQSAVMAAPGAGPFSSYGKHEEASNKLPAHLPSTATAAEQQKWQILTSKLAAIRKESEALRKEIESTPVSVSSKPTVAPKPEFERIIKEAAFAEASKRERESYADFIAESGLTPEIAEQLIQIMTEYSAEGDVSRRKRDGAVRSENQIDEHMRLYNVNQGRLKALLGEEKFKQLRSYERTMLDRHLLRNLTRTLSDMGMPLDASQSQAALTVVREENASNDESYQPDKRRLTREQIIKRITPLLSPEQQAVYQAELKKWSNL